MTKKPIVSVLMTAYNSEKYIKEAIDSVLNQTFSNFEFIIINDGSTDSTSKIVRSYKDKRIKFIDNKTNAGLVAVLNQGLDMCHGKYIARLDSDDISLPQRFETQVAYMEKHPDVGILGTSFCEFGDNIKDRVVIMKQTISYLDVIHRCPIAHPSVMIRRAVLENYKLRYNPEYAHAEDYALWADAILVTQIRNLPDILLRYRNHQTNVSKVFNNIQTQNTMRIRAKMLKFLSDIPDIQKKLANLSYATRLYNPRNLSRHMLWHHPILYFKLKKATN